MTSGEDNSFPTRIPDLRNISFRELRAAVRALDNSAPANVLSEVTAVGDETVTPGWNSVVPVDDEDLPTPE